MNLFSSTEVFSIEIRDKAKPGEKAEALIYSLWRNGIYTIRQTDFSFIDEKPKGYSYKLNQNAYRKAEDYIQKVENAFRAAPDDLNLEYIESKKFTLSFEGKTLSGHFGLFPEDMIKGDQYNLSKLDKRKMRWNNEVVSFVETLTKMLNDIGTKGGMKPLQNNTEELGILKPSTREYILGFRKAYGLEDENKTNRDYLIKKAIRMSLGTDRSPVGETLYSLIGTIKGRAMNILSSSDTCDEFDRQHLELSHDLRAILGEGYSITDSASILDNFYLLSLLILDEIHKDKQLSFLHYPASLGDVYDEESYIEFQKSKRSGKAPSPILNYLGLAVVEDIEEDDFDSYYGEA